MAYLWGCSVQSPWGSLTPPDPRDLFTCTREGLEDALSLRLVNPARKALPLMTVPDLPSFPLPNSTGAGNKGAHDLAKPAFFWVTREWRYPSPKMEMLLILPTRQGLGNAPSLM